MFAEIMMMVMLVIKFVWETEPNPVTGAEKKAKVARQIEKELTDPGGITLTNPWVLKALPLLIPAAIDLVVWQFNRIGFFVSLKQGSGNSTP